MQEELLKYIVCPLCSSISFQLQTEQKNSIEVRRGNILCQHCRASFSVEDGIVDFLPSPSDYVLKERRATVAKLDEILPNRNDEWLLSLPEGLEVSHDYPANFKEAFSRLNLSGNEKVLEIGGGLCWSTARLAELGCYCIATDIVKDRYVGLLSADVFIQRRDVYFERVISDMTELPLQNDSFDVVFCSAAMHHSYDIRKAFDEVRRVLKTGGKFVMIHEPACSILKKPKGWEEEAKRKWGVNENIYSILEYKSFARKAKLRPKFFFAPSSGAKLTELTEGKAEWARPTLRYRLAKLLAYFYQGRIGEYVVERVFFYPILLFAGTQFIMVAEKKDAR